MCSFILALYPLGVETKYLNECTPFPFVSDNIFVRNGSALVEETTKQQF